MTAKAAIRKQSILNPAALEQLFSVLESQEFQIVGPTIRNGTIQYDYIKHWEELPSGWTSEQERASCRLQRRKDDAVFGYVPGADSLKRFLHPPELRLFRAERENGVFRILDNPAPAPKLAFIGVRSCELRALSILDRVLAEDRYPDAAYVAARSRIFIVAVNCSEPAPTCFCASMGSGPEAAGGFDLLLTEIVSDNQHVFVAEAGTSEGSGVLAALNPGEVSKEIKAALRETMDRSKAAFKRKVETEGLRDLLYESFDHPQWDRVAAQCFLCGNCTMVCPTCFCVTVEDSTDVPVRRAERWRKWDSCFTQNFSYIHGGSVRLSPKSRYRQWLTHKMAAWVDQFGTFGCVGCGRCITWCPAGIDVTEQIAVLRGTAVPAASGDAG